MYDCLAILLYRKVQRCLLMSEMNLMLHLSVKSRCVDVTLLLPAIWPWPHLMMIPHLIH